MRKFMYEAFGKVFTFKIPDDLWVLQVYLRTSEDLVELHTPVGNFAPIHINQIRGELEIPDERLAILE
jgi:hypothetical protein